MKLLFIDAFHQFLNPTSALVPVLVARAAPRVDFYGPGYSSDADLEGGVRAYVDRHGPYDGVVLGYHFPLFAWDEERLQHSARSLQRYHAFGPTPETSLPFFRDVMENVRDLPMPFRLISLLNFDYYCATTRHTDILDSLDAYLMVPGGEFAPTLDELPDWAWQERHFIRKNHLISDAWVEYLRRRPDRVLSLPHFVADSEFFFRGLSERRHRVSIPGIEYLMRKEGRKALAKRGLQPARKAMFPLIRYANRMGIHVFANFTMVKTYNAAYQSNLIDTRFAYTARDGYGVLVRKFFEIPAAGALMMCLSPPGFAELGFRDGENYLEVDAESLPDMMVTLEQDMDRAQAIASAGRKLVFDRHSLAARSGQLARCLEAIGQGRFGGSVWKQGDFQLRMRTATVSGMRAQGA